MHNLFDAHAGEHWKQEPSNGDSETFTAHRHALAFACNVPIASYSAWVRLFGVDLKKARYLKTGKDESSETSLAISLSPQSVASSTT